MSWRRGRDVVIVLWMRVVRSGMLGVLEGVSGVIVRGMPLPLPVITEILIVMIIE